jgi:hypothetical protein
VIGLLVAAQLAVIAHGPDTATTCAPFEVTVAARARGTVPPYIAPPVSSATTQLLRSTMISSVERDGAGQQTALTEATFTLATNATGRVSLPAFSASAASEHGTSAPPAVEVHGSNVPLAPTVVVRAWLDRGGHVAPSDTLYVGQQVDYVVDVQLNETARQRLRRNPTFFPPEMPGVLAYDLAPPAALPRTGRHCFETLSYRRALFPLFAGRSAISPASLTYSLPLSTSFFSREESFELRTDSVRFVAVDVPAAGRPADFGGAVGAVSATARLATQKARMGDPVVVTLRLEGTGNVKLWPRPPLSLDWATIANGEERVEVDTSLAQVRGAKEFDWLLTPRKAGQQVVPSLDYPHFDADRRAYAIAHTAPLSIDVASASLATMDSTPVTRYALRRTLRDEVPDSVPSRPWFWILLAVAPVPAATRRLRDSRHRRRSTQSATKRLSVAIAKSESLTARELRRLFLDAVCERVPETIGSTQRGDFARTLRRSGVTPETAESATALLERLDAAAFSAAGAIDQSAATSAAAIVKAIDREAIRPLAKRAAAASASIAFICLLGAASVLGAIPSGQSAAFTEGVEAYDRGAFDSSERLFARVVARAPRAEDAWANLGAAGGGGPPPPPPPRRRARVGARASARSARRRDARPPEHRPAVVAALARLRRARHGQSARAHRAGLLARRLAAARDPAEAPSIRRAPDGRRGNRRRGARADRIARAPRPSRSARPRRAAREPVARRRARLAGRRRERSHW